MTIGVIDYNWYPFDPPLYTNGSSGTDTMNAIFGQLFEQAPNGSMQPDIASGYQYLDKNTEVEIFIRKGVQFSDGIPITASVVQWNITRDIDPTNGCTCDPCFAPVVSVTTKGPLTVLIKLSAPNSTIIPCFEGHAPNYMVPPTVLQSMGETAFAAHPVGAGPFILTQNDPDVSLTFTKNPKYWQKGHPYLNTLIFLNIAQDQPAYAALESGTVQAVAGISTPSILAQAKSSFDVQSLTGTTMGVLQINTYSPPFNNLQAREALAYAINPGPVEHAAIGSYGSLGESMTARGDGVFFVKNVPTYRSYDLAKAKSLVSKLGGLTMTIQGLNTGTDVIEEEAIADQLEQAGIKVTVEPETLTVEKISFANGNWDTIVGCAGGTDPDVGACAFSERLSSHAEYSGLADAALTGLINKSDQLVSPTARNTIFKQIYALIDQDALAIPLYAANTFIVSSKTINPMVVGAGGGASAPGIYLEDLAYK